MVDCVQNMVSDALESLIFCKLLYILKLKLEILLRSTMKKESTSIQRGFCEWGPAKMQEPSLDLKEIQRVHLHYSTLLELQARLNQQLMINLVLTRQLAAVEKNGSSIASTLTGNTEKSPSPEDIKLPEIQKQQKKLKKAITKKKHVQSQQDSDYLPNDSQSNMPTKYKLCQSKNIPKNYGKSILSFIKREKELVERVLNHTGQKNFNKFEQYMAGYKNKINTIADLRSIWQEEHNPYAKALRILSLNYLRKHSFSHIFNSRIQNLKKHIKYRYKIFQGLRKPAEFTQMKDF